MGKNYPTLSLLWERYVENKLDYKSAARCSKQTTSGGDDCLRLLHWLEPMKPTAPGQICVLLREVFAQQLRTEDSRAAKPVKEHATGGANPHDPQAQWSAKGKGKHKKTGWLQVQWPKRCPKRTTKAAEFYHLDSDQKATESDTAAWNRH